MKDYIVLSAAILWLLQVVQEQTALSETEKKFIEAGLVDVHKIDSSILVDLRYSSKNNFLGIDFYGSLEKCYLRKSAATKLGNAQCFLKEIDSSLTLLVWDGARPRSVQQTFWDSIKKPEHLKHLYVARPSEGSIHNYGCGVDLTIAKSNGICLDMGTDFDFFG